MLAFPPLKPAFSCLSARHSMPLASLSVFQSPQVPCPKMLLPECKLREQADFWMTPALLATGSRMSQKNWLRVPILLKQRPWKCHQVLRSPSCRVWTVRLGWMTPETQAHGNVCFSLSSLPNFSRELKLAGVWNYCKVPFTRQMILIQQEGKKAKNHK